MSTRSAQKMATIKAVVAEDRWNASPAQRGFGLSMLWRRLAVTLRAGPAILLWLMLAGCAQAAPSTPATQVAPPAAWTPPALQSGQETYPIGSPVLTDLWVDPLLGDDGRSGASRDQALATISEAWRRIPAGQPLQGTGYRINLMAGDYPESVYPQYWEDRHGTYDFPIILASADGPGAARLLGNMVNVFDVDYLYLLGLRLENEGDVFHCEQCRHLLIRDSVFDGGNRQAHETIKINQSQHVYIENSDIGGSYENAIDFVAVQHGHILNNRIHDADDWCIYLKGGSAYFTLAGNEIDHCGTGGFTAGQGTGFEFMAQPWLHYEAYALKFFNNVIHDTEGAGFGVNGGYDILLAYNTLYRVGSRSHGMEFVFGGRGCDGDTARCAANRDLGGWGTATVGGDEPIPNRNVYVYNNLLYNPPGFRSQWQHFAIHGPRTPPADSGIPNPSRTDDNLQIRGNLIWNGPADLPLGIGDESEGCWSDNPTCNQTQLRADNSINQLQPSLIDPAGGDFRPTPGSLAGVHTVPLPAFPLWDSFTPPVPAGDLANHVPVDRAGQPRPAGGDAPGAYSGQEAAQGRRLFLPSVIRLGFQAN
jgi:hypothetical protein